MALLSVVRTDDSRGEAESRVSHNMPNETYCCKMREKFLVGIIAENPQLPTPVDAADFMDYDAKADDDRPILRIKFCPFCGKPIAGPLRVGG